MPDVMMPRQRHDCMSQIRSKNTNPERLVRQLLWRHGFRYRINVKRLPGSPDIVLPKYRTAIFVHGCFWHGHKGCRNASIPKSNTDFWKAKITRNKERDQEVWRQLEAEGWYVIIVWECQLKKAVLDKTVARVEAEIKTNGRQYRNELENRDSSRKEYRQEMAARKMREAALMEELKSQ